jgi:protoporphyrinogen oxidase
MAALAPKKVVIVGAGFAGLTAARTLLDRAPPGSVSVTILEATDRVGGRARTCVVRIVIPGSVHQQQQQQYVNSKDCRITDSPDV